MFQQEDNKLLSVPQQVLMRELLDDEVTPVLPSVLPAPVCEIVEKFPEGSQPLNTAQLAYWVFTDYIIFKLQE